MKFLVNKGTEIGAKFDENFEGEGIQFTLQWVTLRLQFLNARSWKIYLYRYMEDHGYKKNNKLSQFVTIMKSRNHCSKN